MFMLLTAVRMRITNQVFTAGKILMFMTLITHDDFILLKCELKIEREKIASLDIHKNIIYHYTSYFEVAYY